MARSLDVGVWSFRRARRDGWSPLTVGHSTSYQRTDGVATAEYTRPSKTSNDPAVLVVQTSEFNQLFNAPSLGF